MSASNAATLPTAIFFGTPQLAATVLDGLFSSGIIRVTAVVSQPDKPSGRGQRLQPSPVKQLAEKLGIPVFQPRSLRKDAAELLSWISANERPTVFIVVAYGLIIPQTIIDLPRCGIINVHFSVLPRWRGAAPIQRAIMAGDVESGVSIMRIDEGLDTGPVFSVKKIAISPNDDTGSLTEKLARLGTEELIAKMPEIITGELTPRPQPEVGITYAEKISKGELVVNWNDSAHQISLNIRGLSPVPGARSTFRGELVKFFAGEAAVVTNTSAPIGSVVAIDSEGITVAAGGNTGLRITEMQLAGKKRLAVTEILKSLNIEVGEKFV
jgi:methionyl-tRNA formyltransferase